MATPPTLHPREIRQQLADTLEEIGQAMGLLREAAEDIDDENEGGAKVCASDALEIVASLESIFSDLAAKIARFSES
jgi:hypothetical protein